MPDSKTKECFLEFDVNLAAEVESHEIAGGTGININ